MPSETQTFGYGSQSGMPAFHSVFDDESVDGNADFTQVAGGNLRMHPIQGKMPCCSDA